MSPVLKIILIVVITAGVVGGGTYYFINKKSTDEKSKLQSQIDDLNKQIDGLKSASSVSTTSPATTTPTATTTTPAATTTWKNYSNTQYGFSLTLDDYWKNFEVVTKTADNKYASAYLYICIPTTDTSWPTDQKAGTFCPFVITPVPVANKASFEQAEDPLVPTYIGKNANYDFYYSTAQDRPKDGVNVMNDIKNIIATFKAN